MSRIVGAMRREPQQSTREGGRVAFKPVTPVTAIAAFAISREKNDGARSHATPGEVVMLGKSK